MVNKADKNEARLRRHRRVRGKISGTAERPRLDVFRSAKHIYCQVIDDEAGVTLASASTLEKDFEDYGGNCDAAKKVGERIAKKCLEKGITEWSMTAAVSYTTAVLRHLLKVPVKRPETVRREKIQWPCRETENKMTA